MTNSPTNQSLGIDTASDEMEVDEKIDTALVLLDNMKQEKKNAKNNMKPFCKCKLMERKIYQTLLFNENKAWNWNCSVALSISFLWS